MLKLGQHMLVGALAVAALGSSPALADVKTGVDAYQRGDYPAALAEWRPLADRGDPDAQFNLAQAYKLGRGVPANLDTAIGWYRKAAVQNHEEATALLGLLLFQNNRRAEAMPWLSKAADQGDSASQYVYGTALFNGDMVATDWPRAYSLMTRAASQGLPPARTALLEMDKHIPLAQRQQGVALARAAGTGRAPAPVSVAPPIRIANNTPPIRVVNNTPPPVPAPVRVSPADNGPPARPVPMAGMAPPRPMPGMAPPAPPMTTARPAAPRHISIKPAPTPRAAPAPRVAARPAPRAPAPTRTGGWRIQLGAFGNPGGANALFASLKKRVGALSGAQPMLVKAGAVTRLQAGPFASRAAATSACAAVKSAGQACFAVAP